MSTSRALWFCYQSPIVYYLVNSIHWNKTFFNFIFFVILLLIFYFSPRVYKWGFVKVIGVIKYEITRRVGKVAYKLQLPAEMSTIHNVFHVSMLKKYIPNPDHVLMPQTIQVQVDLSYEEKPMEILDRTVMKLRNKEISLVKVLWRNHRVKEATWEPEDDMRKDYPVLF